MSEFESAWSDEEGVRRAGERFAAAFGYPPDGVWAAPGRVNLIGEHTDYNDGLSLPVALPHRTFVAAARRDDDRVRLTTAMADTPVWEGTVADVRPGAVEGWIAYCAGPLWALREDGVDVPGVDLAIVSCVPLGAGLSSSAAVECGVGLALAELAGTPLDGDDAARARLAALCVRAENEVAGAPTGGMDQAASLRARAGAALLLDSRDGTVTHVPLDLTAAGLALLVMDTRAEHSLGDGQYGARRADCEAAAATLGVDSLRVVADEVPADALDAEVLARLDAEVLARLDGGCVRARVRHVVTEIHRVTGLVEAARAGRWPEVGALMNASHDSLRDDYEVSCRELDVVVDAARDAGALGARMTGGGFGGSAIALVHRVQVEDVARRVVAAAAAAGTPTPTLLLAEPGGPGERLTTGA